MRLQQFLAALAMTACLAEAAGTQGNRFGGGAAANKGKGAGTVATKTSAAAAVVATSTPVAASNAKSTGTASTNTGGNTNANVLELNPSAVQTGSQSDGTQASGAVAGEVPSQTDAANFINNCVGKVLMNGLQIKSGSCNGITMGDIPASTDMVSSMIIFPATGQTVTADQTFNISVQLQGLVPGFFTNADATYYAAPQALQGGKIVGHTHVTVQNLGDSLNPSTPPDPAVFAFFKGINDAGNGQGLLQAVVTGGLAAGNYRVCTMASSSNHQPVLMPVAQRGAQDDCTKFVVTAGAGGASTGTGAASGSTGSTSTTTAATTATSTTAAKAGTGATGATGKTGTGAATGKTGTGAATGKTGTGAAAGGTATQKGKTTPGAAGKAPKFGRRFAA